MDDTNQPVATRATPVHLWVIGLLSLLWNCFGAYDFVMTKARNATYLARMPAEVAHYIDSLPGWLTIFWALGVWGAVGGSLLLLLRNRLAVPLFGLSLLGLAVTQFYQHVVNPAPAEMRGGMMLGIVVLIWAIAIALWVYARAMARRGVLR